MFSSRTQAASPVRDISYTLAFATASRSYQIRLPRALWAAIFVGLPLIGTVYLGATAYWIFHDDLLASLMRRQVDMQYAYEDRIGLLRHEIESVTLRARSEESRFNGDLANLAQRQSKAENRTALILALSERLKAFHAPDMKSLADAVAKDDAGAIDPLPTGTLTNEPRAVNGVPAPQSLPTGKPHPEPLDLRLGDEQQSFNEGSSASPRIAAAALPNMPENIASLAATYDRLDAQQTRVLANLIVPAHRSAERIRTALAATGLSLENIKLNAASRNKKSPAGDVGGPFIPLPATTDHSAFAEQASVLTAALSTSADLYALLPHIPLRRPIYGPTEVTSPFGPRLDPFFGRAAMHTGVDLHADYGAPVRATADGTVVFAGANGGYGNMVEVDHGGGLTTRYAHLSAILVVIDQKVETGTILGRIGTTGRSTGPHLHYETRIGGEAVDPERFLKAGALLFGQADNAPRPIASR